jgi:hypothetical protein
VGSKLGKLRRARSALGPCHNGPAWAAAVANGRQRFGGTAGHRPRSSCSWDDAGGRFRLWSRRAGVRVPSVTPLHPRSSGAISRLTDGSLTSSSGGWSALRSFRRPELGHHNPRGSCRRPCRDRAAGSCLKGSSSPPGPSTEPSSSSTPTPQRCWYVHPHWSNPAATTIHTGRVH